MAPYASQSLADLNEVFLSLVHDTTLGRIANTATEGINWIDEIKWDKCKTLNLDFLNVEQEIYGSRLV